MNLNKEFWDQRYVSNDTGWDASNITTPIKDYFDQLDDKDKNLRVLVPGCGNAHEAEYVFRSGFKNVFVADISAFPLENFKKRVPEFPAEQLLHVDFFLLKDSFDIIIEQTFFCALDPKLRPEYAAKMAELLKPGGRLVGVLFNDTLNNDKPPFGGTKEEYISYFRPYFEIKYFETCTNSIPPRAGRELFIYLIKK
ncbi:MAG: methyltransferase domain-containing protein [Sporocytophaga sp.]|uniref:methyltransferase n=1 Tax=Sporocytophaga sp. TaxID=2231183 RepID=UPI001B028088|nr:methyltransferase domain-containing protein [Sporocytophaga sp.]MBO9701357.1 methyltransferase domain-containing protein [Sporocytophaga sp.]